MPKSVTFNDLELRNDRRPALYLCISWASCLCLA